MVACVDRNKQNHILQNDVIPSFFGKSVTVAYMQQQKKSYRLSSKQTQR